MTKVFLATVVAGSLYANAQTRSDSNADQASGFRQETVTTQSIKAESADENLLTVKGENSINEDVSIGTDETTSINSATKIKLGGNQINVGADGILGL